MGQHQGLRVRSINLAGLALLKRFEGFRDTPYHCPSGRLTIGYGHVIRDGEHFTPPISQAQALSLLARDLESAAVVIEALVLAPLTDDQFAALASFVYNIGGSNFARSTLLKRLNQLDYTSAANELLRWKFGTVNGVKTLLGGLAARRRAERELFLSTEA